ncbi:MAG: zf-TFIIB domain-containing protein [Myxococcales bacterium]|nr:zf-TFIIB domain-containing protein [Myxococcales bacterium]
MRCPRCETALLDERERDGILLDTCQACRGIWLDRGELERLLARAHLEEERRHLGRDEPPDSDHEPDSDRRPFGAPGGRPPAPPRKRRWFDALGDLFD